MDDIGSGTEPAGGLKGLSASAIKQCCAAIYDSDVARLLLGESFHPGGTKLTERLGQFLNLGPRTRVLDVAAGKGTSALFLATRFGCEVVGIDFSQRNVDHAEREANVRGLSGKVDFQCGDAEQLPFDDGSFDAVICECALCTFPNKRAAASEFVRVLRASGGVGLSDLTRQGALAPQLDDLVSWVACIGDALPLSGYVDLLSGAKLDVQVTEEHNDVLTEYVNQMRSRLLVAEVMTGLKKLALPGFDIESAKEIAKHALAAIDARNLGYALIVAMKPASPQQRGDTLVG